MRADRPPIPAENLRPLTPAWVAPLYFASTAKLNSAYIAVSPFGRAWNKTRTAPSGSDPIAAGRRCPGGWIGWRRPKFP